MTDLDRQATAPREEQASTVLILSTDAITAALLSILAELEGYTPVFTSRGESSLEGLARLRPTVVLVDCDHEACTDSLFDLASGLGVKVVIFSPGRMKDDIRAFAEERSLPWFSLPIDRASLAQIIRSGLAALLPLAVLGALR